MAFVFAAVVFTDDSLAVSSKGSKGRLSANQFISMQPFNIPMTPNGREKRQFTLVVALELTDEDDREFVQSRVTLIRSRTYDLLFRLIAYRTQEPLIPNTGLIKRKMLDIVAAVLGQKKVESIIVQQVYHGRAP
jgi:flagellar basal body-associated protein FliL